MPKSIEELAASKPGSTRESNGFGGAERPLRPAGVYRHEASGTEMIVKNHRLFGDSQAAAAERLGFKYSRPATKDDVKTVEIVASAAPTDSSNDEMKGILARMNEQDATIAKLQGELAKKNEETVPAIDAPAEEAMPEPETNSALADIEDEIQDVEDSIEDEKTTPTETEAPKETKKTKK